jgi:hypothetical protein
LIYSTYLGGAADDTATDIALDSAGQRLHHGFFALERLPGDCGCDSAHQRRLWRAGARCEFRQGFDTERVRNSGDAFLVKMSPAGALTYSSFFGGN